MEVINIEKQLLTFDQIRDMLNKVLQDDTTFKVTRIWGKYKTVEKYVAIKNCFTKEEFRCSLERSSNQTDYRLNIYLPDYWDAIEISLTEEEYCSLIPIFNKLYVKHEKDLVEKFNECFRVDTVDDVF